MSDSGIELAYEEDLQAEAALRLYVNGSLKRVEPNTAVGRDVMEKAAMLASLKSENVEVRPGGRRFAVKEPEPREPRPAGDRPFSRPVERASVSASVGTSEPASGCCVPTPYAGPSGVRNRHAWDCPHAGGQVFVSPVTDLPRARLTRKHSIETRRYGLDDAMRDHPAGGTLSPEAHDRWHPGQGEDCVECAERGD